ncbi:cytochrome P450 [Salix suchowensis]|nr:cytochrome P450 [Salix suchowensis]
MESAWNLLAGLGLFMSAALFLLLKQRKSRVDTRNHPPGPPAWPIFGNIFDLGAIPHQTFYKLKEKYGPVIWLKLGYTNTLVIQSAEAAAELFKNHDLAFSDRKVPLVLTAHDYNQGSMAIGRYGPNWRMLRRLCSSKLMITKQLDQTAVLRQKCIDDMIKYIEEDVAHYLFIMTFNLIGNLVLSRDLVSPRSIDGREFYDAMNKLTKWAGTPNVADFFPFLKWLDPQGIMRNMVQTMGQAMRIVEKFVKERTEERKSGRKKTKDFLDALLEYEGDGKDEPDVISDQNRRTIILEMFFAGSETTSTTLEWAMTELLRDPVVMGRATEELHQVVGPQRKVEESDIDQLPYLQAVIKETMRLHPVVPLLLPRNTLEDTNFMGYLIPKDTQVFVNVWAIGRDPDSWEDPMAFKPERFLGSNIEYRGQNFELIPFGAGRRICVGISLAHRVLHLGLASLLHCFEWELGSNYTPETIDMNETVGLASSKLKPLEAKPKKGRENNK